MDNSKAKQNSIMTFHYSFASKMYLVLKSKCFRCLTVRINKTAYKHFIFRALKKVILLANGTVLDSEQ